MDWHEIWNKLTGGNEFLNSVVRAGSNTDSQAGVVNSGLNSGPGVNSGLGSGPGIITGLGSGAGADTGLGSGAGANNGLGSGAGADNGLWSRNRAIENHLFFLTRS